VASAAQTLARTTTWKHFPRAMLAIMALVIAVNVRFIVLAVVTFPGQATNDDFDTSNRYNAVLEADARQSALGWTEHATVQGRLVTLDLSGLAQAPLAGAAITATADRPLGTDAAMPVDFHETSPGHFVSTVAWAHPGQWNLNLRITHGGNKARVTRRIVVQ
jgi:nitrogen fixation protein FixH